MNNVARLDDDTLIADFDMGIIDNVLVRESTSRSHTTRMSRRVTLEPMPSPMNDETCVTESDTDIIDGDKHLNDDADIIEDHLHIIDEVYLTQGIKQSLTSLSSPRSRCTSTGTPTTKLTYNRGRRHTEGSACDTLRGVSHDGR